MISENKQISKYIVDIGNKVPQCQKGNHKYEYGGSYNELHSIQLELEISVEIHNFQYLSHGTVCVIMYV